MSKINVLLADDHRIVRGTLKMFLNTNEEIEIIGEASNGYELIDFLEENYTKVNVVVTDINMPSMDGIEATQLITQKFPNINVLALSMHSDGDYILKMLKAGALGYVLKDSSVEVLVEAIKKVANGENYYSKSASATIIDRLMNSPESAKTDSVLSKREVSVLNEVAKGLTNNEIAKVLEISNRTVESHRRNMLKKLKLKNTVELLNYARKEGIIE